MRARFIPRILAADPETLLDDDRRQLRAGENPRRHDAAGEIRRPQRALDRHRHHRSRGLGCGREDRRQAAASCAGRALQQRQGRHQGLLLCRRRLVLPRPDRAGPAGRDPPASRRRLHHDEDEGRRRARSPRTCGASRPSKASCRQAPSSRSTPIRNSSATRRSPMRRRWRRSGCAGSRSRAIRSTIALLAEIAERLRAAARHRREPVLDAGRREPRALRRPARRSAAT